MVPTKILICVTPEENILGISFLKNILISLVILIVKLIFGLKNFFTNIIKNTACIKPAIETPYDK